MYESDHPNIEDDFFNKAVLPQLKDNEKAYLETDIQDMVVKAAIKAPPAGKAPGQGGYSIEFYESNCLQFWS